MALAILPNLPEVWVVSVAASLVMFKDKEPVFGEEIVIENQVWNRVDCGQWIRRPGENIRVLPCGFVAAKPEYIVLVDRNLVLNSQLSHQFFYEPHTASKFVDICSVSTTS